MSLYELTTAGGFMVGEPMTLFDGGASEVLAAHAGAVRHDQPATAHAAAAAAAPRIGGQKRACLLALAAAGERGLTAHEACALTPCLYPHVASTRIASLVKLGLAERTDGTRLSPAGYPALVFRITPAGRRVAAELSE